MYRFNKSAFLLLMCTLASLANGCADKISAPTAVIASVDLSRKASPLSGSESGGDQCKGIEGELAGNIGQAPEITAECSRDPQGMQLFYHWKVIDQPTGSEAVLHDEDLITPTFIPDVSGRYRIVLVVSNGVVDSEPADLVINVSKCGGQDPMIGAIAVEPTGSPAVGQAVRAVPSVSDADSDPKCDAHDPVFGYDWVVEMAPTGSSVALNSATAETPSFVPDVPGTYVLRVTVTDPTGRMTTDIVTIDVGTCGSNAPTVVASAVPPSVATGESTQLQAVGSDADMVKPCNLSQTLTYSWHFVSLPAGSAAMLNGAQAERPTFVADVPGDYVAEVVVTDSTGLQSSAQVTVTADVCGSNAPTVVASASPSSVVTGEATQLAAVGADADIGDTCALSQTLSYAWHFVSLPAGSAAMLNGVQAIHPTFVADVPGDYVAEVIVTDSTGLQGSAQVTVTADVCGSNAPVADIQILGPGGSHSCGDTIDLGGNNSVLVSAANSSDADNTGACGLDQSLFYSWHVLSVPLNSSGAEIRPADAMQAVVRTQDNGTFTIRLFVTDETGLVSKEVTCSFSVTNAG